MKKEKLIQNIKQRIKFIYYCLENGIENDDDNQLWTFIYIAFGIKISRKAVCKDHSAPFEFVSDIFFNRVDNCLIIGARGSGKTYLMSLVNFLNMVFKPGISICNAAATMDQSQAAYDFFKEFMEKWWFDTRLIKKCIEKETRFTTKSKIQLIVGKETGFNSKHNSILVVDELEVLNDWETLQQGMSITMSNNGYPGQNILMSTRKKASGLVQKLYKERHELGLKVYLFCIFEVLEKCKRNIRCEECRIYTRCEGLARKTTGHYSINDFMTRAKLLDRIAFNNEIVCKTPISSGQFFDFNRKDHIIDVKTFCNRYNVKYEEGLSPQQAVEQSSFMRLVAIDWGYGDPVVFLAFAYDSEKDILYCYHELYEKQLSSIDVIQAWQGATKHPTGKMVVTPNSFNWNNEPFTILVCDTNRPDTRVDINRLRKGRPQLLPIRNKEKNLEYSYEKVKERLMISDNGLPGLVFFDNCTNAIREHESLTMGSNGLPPKASEDHTTDATRYAVVRLFHWLKGKKYAEVCEKSLERFMG